MTPQEELAKCERMVAIGNEFFAMTRSPVNVDNIPGELTRDLTIAYWHSLIDSRINPIAETMQKYARRGKELRQQT